MKGFNVYTEFFCTVCFPTYVFPVFWSWLHECKQYITMHGHYRHPPGFVSRLIVSSLRSWNTSDRPPTPPHTCAGAAGSALGWFLNQLLLRVDACIVSWPRRMYSPDLKHLFDFSVRSAVCSNIVFPIFVLDHVSHDQNMNK